MKRERERDDACSLSFEENSQEDTGGGRQDIFGTYSQQECGRKREVGDEVSVERETLLSSDFESQAKKDDSERDRKTV